MEEIKKYVVVSEKKWHNAIFDQLQQHIKAEWIRITSPDELTLEQMEAIRPDYIFFPHWSYLIPESIYNQFTCIVFHMTNLPYGRGGSPLQNLIVRGHAMTKLSAIRVQQGIDTGDVYLKKELSLLGTAQEIFIRTGIIIGEMIIEIIEKNICPQPQTGEIILFKRRKPEDSNMEKLDSLNDVYDYIRMLDCDGYPSAFIENENFRFEFSRASLKDNNIIADVRIIKK